LGHGRGGHAEAANWSASAALGLFPFPFSHSSSTFFSPSTTTPQVPPFSLS